MRKLAVKHYKGNCSGNNRRDDAKADEEFGVIQQTAAPRNEPRASRKGAHPPPRAKGI
jgi:hypothetical protein